MVERRGNNVPRYRNGKGQDCAVQHLGSVVRRLLDLDLEPRRLQVPPRTSILWPSYDGTMVGVQVRDPTNWATRNGYFSHRPNRATSSLTETTHIGIVEKIDRTTGRAVGLDRGQHRQPVNRGDRADGPGHRIHQPGAADPDPARQECRLR